MKKIGFFIVALTMISASVNAQNDPNAKKILDAVSAKLKSYGGITAAFNLLSKGKTGKVNNNVTGKIAIKGNKYYIKQGASEIFSNGATTWNYNGNDEVTVTGADADADALTPQKLLTNFYDKDFTYKLVSTAGAYNEIQMSPNDKRKNFKQINVFVDKSKMMITKARVLDKSNNTINFNLNNINTSATIPENAFVFDKKKYNKNIEVIQ